MPRHRAEEVKEEQKHRVYMENRMNALLELKNDIEASQVTASTMMHTLLHKHTYTCTHARTHAHTHTRVRAYYARTHTAHMYMYAHKTLLMLLNTLLG